MTRATPLPVSAPHAGSAPEITIVGAGLAGLVAAIELAEAGLRVVVHDAAGRAGGRARTDASRHRVNLGPHALYRRGDFGAWLQRKQLLPAVHYPSLTGLRLLKAGRARRYAPGLLKVMRSGNKEAPVDENYRDWARREFGPEVARFAIGFASLPTYHPDPGSLSAAFVQERVARSVAWRPVWYLNGGWERLIERLVERAGHLGVRIETRSKLQALPDGPCIVATGLEAAASLLDDPSLEWPSADSALFDVALRKKWNEPTAVLDVDDHAYISRYSAGDASIAPPGESLLQGVTGIRDSESPDEARDRIYALLDAGFAGWRDRVVWQRKGVTRSAVGPCDPPGTSWRDRPAIDRGSERWLIGDRVAAPGVLAETCFESARIAAGLVLAKYA